MLKRNQLTTEAFCRILHLFQPRRSTYRIIAGSLRVIGKGDEPESFQVDRFRCSFQISVKSLRSGIVIARNKDDGKTDASEKVIQFSKKRCRFRIIRIVQAVSGDQNEVRIARLIKIECFLKQLQSQFAAPGRYLRIGATRIMQVRNDRTTQRCGV